MTYPESVKQVALSNNEVGPGKCSDYSVQTEAQDTNSIVRNAHWIRTLQSIHPDKSKNQTHNNTHWKPEIEVARTNTSDIQILNKLVLDSYSDY